MLKNYFKTALRNLLKYKNHSLINILGLATGIACCILILLFVRNELSYDTFHAKKNRLYRAVCTLDLGARQLTSPNFPMPFGPALSAEIPEIQSTVRFQKRTAVVRYQDNLVREELLFSDPAILQVFTFPLIAGDPATALQSPGAVVISRAVAQKYFGNEDPLGKQISLRLSEAELPFFISGVAENIPENSSIKFDFLAPYDRLVDLSEGARVRAQDWSSFNSVTFVLLHENSKPADLETKFAAFTKKYFEDPTTLFLQPLTDIHLNPELGSGGLEPVSDPKYSYILAGIALMVLLIACINFMTITLGRSSGRSREVGMRKVLGAQRLQLVKQFWSEAMLMSLFALVLGIALAEFFLPAFNRLTEKNLSLNLTSDGLTALGLLGLMLLTGLVAGSYPALLLSKYQPVEVFKGNLKLGGATAFGKWLVVLQFSLSIFLIVSTMIMTQQKRYLMTKNLGFNDDQVIIIPTIKEEEGEKLLNLFRNQLASHQNVLNLSGAGFSINRGTHQVSASFEEKQIRTYEFRVEYDYLATMGIELLQGRNFSRAYPTDPAEAAIVNEALVKEFGWEQPVGKTFKFRGRDMNVIGVVKDYHFESLRSQIAPVVLNLDPETPLRYLLAKIQSHDMPATISLLQSTWKSLAPDLPFEYYFLDNDVAQQYRAEQRWGNIVTYSSVFAIVIACLGLFGLSALSVTRRTKEIGIRKVLGASLGGLVGLINKEFLLLVVLGNVVAWPVAWYAMNRWLQGFAYRVEIGFGVFALAGAVALLIALLTVSTQAIKAALANPVEALRYE
ncbi:ABC transporter permease [candidate division KSB1 bacterium]|nr:ABC transporter permease [candidate division KSB1 bacterium]